MYYSSMSSRRSCIYGECSKMEITGETRDAKNNTQGGTGALIRKAGLNTNFLVYWSIVQFFQNFIGQNASCTGQVQEQLK